MRARAVRESEEGSELFSHGWGVRVRGGRKGEASYFRCGWGGVCELMAAGREEANECRCGCGGLRNRVVARREEVIHFSIKGMWERAVAAAEDANDFSWKLVRTETPEQRERAQKGETWEI